MVGSSGGEEEWWWGGEVVVKPGASLVVDCVYRRSSGTPEWVWDNMTAEYPTGWATNTPDNNWLYRLELQNVSVWESGEYSCTSQRGYTNTLRLLVTDLQCQGAPLYSQHVHSNVTGPSHDIGTKVKFSCPPGFDLQGDTMAECRDDGEYEMMMMMVRWICCFVRKLVRSRHQV